MLRAQTILHLHETATRRWHLALSSPLVESPLEALTVDQHQANYELWHEEDKARSPFAADASIAQVKHAIDAINQRRNDLVEQIDTLLLTAAGDQNPRAPLHSETPGLIIDRLSILELKLYHTAEETHRDSATAQHREKNLRRLEILEQQRADLSCCLDELWLAVLAGNRRFRLYRQLKMYNDPELNPVLYSGA